MRVEIKELHQRLKITTVYVTHAFDGLDRYRLRIVLATGALQQRFVRINVGNGGDQRRRIRMLRPREHLFGTAFLNDLAAIHHNHAFAEIADDREIVGDKHQREVHLRRELAKELDDLRLDGNVEGGDALVGDDQFRVDGQRAGDAGALALATAHESAYTLFDTRAKSVGTIRLTERERECLRHSAEGYSAKEISRIIDRSVPTVVMHLNAATKKLGARNRTQAVVRATHYRLLEDRPTHNWPPYNL